MSRAPRWLIVAIAALALLAPLVAGCASSDQDSLRDWTLLVPGRAPRRVHLPASFAADLPAYPVLYRLRTDVPLSPELRGKELVLTVPAFDAFSTLLVGAEAFEPMERSAFDRSRPSHRRATFRIPADATSVDVLPLELEVEHTDVFTSHALAAPELEVGAYDRSAALVSRSLEEWLLAGMVLLLSLLFVASSVAFLLDRTRRAAGWFALMTAGLAVWHMAILGVTQVVDPRDLVRVPIWTTTVIAISGVEFVHAHFRLKAPPRAVLALIAGLGGLGLALAWPRFASMVVPGLLLDGMVLVAIGYLTWRLGALARRGTRRVEAMCMLAAWLCIGAAALLGTPMVRPVVWMAFVLVQAVLLVRAHTASLRLVSMQLAVRVTLLEERNQDVARLNEELRRQLGDRSARLAEALSNLGPLPERRAEPLAAGTLLVGRYRVLRTLGAGGMGAVYEVERTTDARHFALKTVIHAHGSALARLAREAEIATKVAHPNLVGIVDIDVAPSGVMFLVMELVPGRPLSAEAKRFGDVPWARGILRQVAAGLHALHEAGVVHRDLKPANVLLEETPGGAPRAKIADFGIARAGDTTEPGTAPAPIDPEAATVQVPAGHDAQRAASDAHLTRTGVVMGTPLYMAPELLAGARDAPPSSDMWSFGVMACELLTGRRPFDESPVMRALDGRVSAAPPLDTTALPAALRPIVVRCLDRDPARRPTAAEVEVALAAAPAAPG
ncbi:MAG: protein kinase domain-containing protein [Polyangiaceae bacterium]